MKIPEEEFYKLHGVTPPRLLEHLVDELPDIPDLELSDFADVIVKLHRHKDYSFTKIVDFLKGHGIETNRSAVYRVYKDALDPTPEQEPLIDDETGEVIET